MDDVTVRIPVAFDRPEDMALWVERAINKAMGESGWIGDCAVIFRTGSGALTMHDGIMQRILTPEIAVLPHGLVEPEDQATDRLHRPPCGICGHRYEVHYAEGGDEGCAMHVFADHHTAIVGIVKREVVECKCPRYEPKSYDTEPGPTLPILCEHGEPFPHVFNDDPSGDYRSARHCKGPILKSPAQVDKPQPPPTPGVGDIQTLVIEDIAARREFGIAKYGTPLQAFNGRDGLMDAYQEALDLVVYLRQVIEEGKGS